MKKILLITVSVETVNPHAPNILSNKAHKPLGILSLASYLQARNIPTHCIDQRIEDPFPYIEKFNSELLFVGFSVMSAHYGAALMLLKKIKSIAPQITCVIGGPHASAAYAQSLQDGFDLAVIGEGEESCAAIVDACQQASTEEQFADAIRTVPGIAYKDASGQITLNPRTGFIDDLDTLPIIDRGLLASHCYSPTSVSLITSRGCPGRCIFCQSGPNLFGQQIRQRSVSHVLREIELLLNTGVTFITFLDDCLLWNEYWVHEFCNKIKELRYRFKWICETRAQFITESIIKKTIEAGCVGLNIGFESGSDATLQFLQKGSNLAVYSQALDVLHRYGLNYHTYIIIGSPHETKDDLAQTVEFIKKARPTQVCVSRLTPIFGSKLYDYLEEKKMFTTCTGSDQVFYRNRFPINCEHLTEADLDYFETEIYRTMYIPGELPEKLSGNALLFDDPIPAALIGKRTYYGSLRVKNKSNFHWHAYPRENTVPFAEVGVKKIIRDNFIQQIEGKRVELFLEWFDAQMRHLGTAYAGHLVGNVPVNHQGTFTLEYRAPLAEGSVFFRYNLYLPDDKISLAELGWRPSLRQIEIHIPPEQQTASIPQPLDNLAARRNRLRVALECIQQKGNYESVCRREGITLEELKQWILEARAAATSAR
ncbi:MAG: B12-binding domain-containing radical SAM protein [Candidatus Omnitrophica bacterium]|nr:B12-binding domain-containing radical SAM protein [Candidatus Omnitrophota bacterium]